jgi:hypothetical protein
MAGFFFLAARKKIPAMHGGRAGAWLEVHVATWGED